MDSKDKKLEELLEKYKNFESSSDNLEWIIGLILIWGLFGNWDKDNKHEELDKRLTKLEGKQEIIEQIILK